MWLGAHPDRDAQSGYLADQASEHLAAGQPLVSVDAKKKELVGQFKNGDADMDALPIHRHDWHGEWNYTLHPGPDTPDTS